MVDIHDYDIKCVEDEILWTYDDPRNDYSNCGCLLSLRKDMINKRVLAHQEEILPDIIAFNDALTGLWRRAGSNCKMFPFLRLSEIASYSGRRQTETMVCSL